MDTSTSEPWRDVCPDAAPPVVDRRKQVVNTWPETAPLGGSAVHERRRRVSHLGRLARPAVPQIVLFSVYCTMGQGLLWASRECWVRLARVLSRKPGAFRDMPQPDRRRSSGANRAGIAAGSQATDWLQQLSGEVRAACSSNRLSVLALKLSPLPSIAATLPEADMAALCTATSPKDHHPNRGALRTLLVFSLALAPPLVAQPSQSHRTSQVSVYRRLYVYPLRERDPDALRAGDEHTAIDATAGICGVSTPGLAQAGRLFDRRERTEAAREGLGRPAQNDARLVLAARSVPGRAIDCRNSDTLACRARRGFERLHAGQLAAAQSELDDPTFAHSEQGITLRRALAQRAIYQGDKARALAQFELLGAAGQLRADERNQWFALLLQAGRLDQAHRLQAQGGLEMPQQQLALAHAWADRGELTAVAAYMAERRPDFTREAQERQWLYLLGYLGDLRPNLLHDYRVRFAANREVQSRLLLPLSTARSGTVAVHLQHPTFRQARFSLVLRAGRFDEATRLAEVVLAAPGGGALIDPVSRQLIDAGARAQAKALLLRAYPFGGSDQAECLMHRLGQIAGAQPALFTTSDLEIVCQPPDNVALRGRHASLLASLAGCDGMRALMDSLALPAEAPRDGDKGQAGDAGADTRKDSPTGEASSPAMAC